MHSGWIALDIILARSRRECAPHFHRKLDQGSVRSSNNMDNANPTRLLIALTSDSDRKTMRFITSLVASLSETQNRTQWQITILRPPPYNGSALLLPPSVVSQLQRLNVSFLQPQVHLSQVIPFQEFLFCTHNDSYSIAAQRNRGLLAVNDLLQITTVDLIAVLDDDLIFQNALLKRNQHGDLCVSFETTHDYIAGLETIYALARTGPVIGGSTGCPPIPGVSAIRCAIEDITNNVNNLSPTELCVAQEADYYYDFREHSNFTLPRGAWLSYYYNDELFAPSFSNILLGVTPTRPLIFNGDRLFLGQEPSIRRGGNTYFANAQHLLSIPHVTLCVDGLSTRRSDMIVAEIAKQRGIVYRETYFPLGHLRVANTVAISRLGMLSSIEAELFGVALHRGIASFIARGDHMKAWKDIFARRLLQIMQTRSYIDRASLPSHIGREVMELADGLDYNHIYERVVMREKQFFQQYVRLVERYSEIDQYWMTLIEEHKYEVNY